MHLGVTGVRLSLGQRRDALSVHRAASAVWLLGGYSSYPPPTRGMHPDRGLASTTPSRHPYSAGTTGGRWVDERVATGKLACVAIVRTSRAKRRRAKWPVAAYR
eukprot:1185466-Pleurochrysis_carterae.AAC.1